MYQLNLKTGMFGSCSFASYEGAKKKPQTFSGIRPKRHQASFGHAVLVEPVTHMSGELSDGLPQNGNPVLLSNLRYPEVPSGVIKHGWLENPRTQWSFLARNLTDFYGPLSSTSCLMTTEGISL